MVMIFQGWIKIGDYLVIKIMVKTSIKKQTMKHKSAQALARKGCIIHLITKEEVMTAGQIALLRICKKHIQSGELNEASEVIDSLIEAWLHQPVTRKGAFYAIATAVGDVLREKMKPKCKLVGQDGNMFNLIAVVSQTLKKAGLRDQANEMTKKCFQASSYDEALAIMMDYIEVS